MWPPNFKVDGDRFSNASCRVVVPVVGSGSVRWFGRMAKWPDQHKGRLESHGRSFPDWRQCGLWESGILSSPRSLIEMGVSTNRGTPKSSIPTGFSLIFTIQFGGVNTPIFCSTPKWFEISRSQKAFDSLQMIFGGLVMWFGEISKKSLGKLGGEHVWLAVTGWIYP